MENKQKFFKAKFNDTKKIISYKKSFEDLLANLEQSFKINLIPIDLLHHNNLNYLSNYQKINISY